MSPKPPQDQDIFKSVKKTEIPLEFVYVNDFDENGALFYLGTMGRKTGWKNPSLLSLVRPFATSIGSGKIEDLTGRQVVNLRTMNEPFSSMGVDLGEERKLILTCYTIKNRDFSNHVMLNWQLEASNDKQNWSVLDKRMHWFKDEEFNQKYADIRKLLQQKGATSTWGIDPDEIIKYEGGFRCFRIVQTSLNSSGSDNMSLSGIELYGRPAGGKWLI